MATIYPAKAIPALKAIGVNNSKMASPLKRAIRLWPQQNRKQPEGPAPHGNLFSLSILNIVGNGNRTVMALAYRRISAFIALSVAAAQYGRKEADRNSTGNGKGNTFTAMVMVFSCFL